MTFVFGEVVANEFLCSRLQFNPVAILNLSGIAGTFLLLLHLFTELLFVDGIAILTANQFGKVERETIGVEETEGTDTVEDRFALCFQVVHGIVEQVDAALQSTEERLFLFLHHTSDEFALSRQLGEGFTHLFDEHGQEPEEEALFLSEERIGIADGTTEDAADDISSLSIRRQLSVGNGEGNGTQVVSTDTHGHVDVFVVTVVFACQSLFLADDGLEDIGVVVRLLVLQGTHQSLEAHTGVDDLHGELFQ